MDMLDQLGIKPELLLTQIIGFLILLAILNKFAFKPLFGILDQRQADIKATYDQLDDDRRRMEETRREYQERLAGIEAEAREKIQAAVKEAQDLRANLIADAQKQADTIIEGGRVESERERQKAFLEMRQQVVSLSIAAAGKVVGASLDTGGHARMVEDFITSVGTGAISEAGRGVSHNAIAVNGASAG